MWRNGHRRSLPSPLASGAGAARGRCAHDGTDLANGSVAYIRNRRRIMFINRIAISMSVAALFSACADDVAVVDELASESALDSEPSQEAGADTFTYFHVEADRRRCSWPMCGGDFVSRVNRALTRC